jgi:hypothetical protein
MLCVVNPRLREIKESDGEAMLAATIDKLPENDRTRLKDMLHGPVERITLNPKNISPL